MKGTQARTVWRAFAAQYPPEQLRRALHAAVDALVDELAAESPRRGRPARHAPPPEPPRPPEAHPEAVADPEAVTDPEVLALESELRRKGVIL